MKSVASLRYGVIFKKAFSQPDIFQAFAEAILGIKLHIDHVETEKSFDQAIGNVDTQFDLFAEDKVNRLIIDIQHQRYPDHYHRFLHYHCAALLEQAVSARDYRPTLTVYTIVVLTSGDKHRRDMSMIDFDPKDRHGVPLGEIKHKVIYLCPKYHSNETPAEWREWLQAIDDSLDEKVDESQYKNACIQKVISLIEQDSLSPKERADMKDEYSKALLLLEEREKFRQLQQQLAHTQQAHQQQLQAHQQQLRDMAKVLLIQGLPIETIAELTQLSLKDLQALY
jgi:predicted transposase/invertase (TIGR01784 family)